MSFGPGDALALPFPDDSFDAVTATQVYEYVADMPAALAEARRVLRPGGRLLILDTDWDSLVWHSSDSEDVGEPRSGRPDPSSDWLRAFNGICRSVRCGARCALTRLAV